jgi:hypothetical protein
MKILIRLGLVLMSPYLLFVYWHIHAELELSYE